MRKRVLLCLPSEGMPQVQELRGGVPILLKGEIEKRMFFVPRKRGRFYLVSVHKLWFFKKSSFPDLIGESSVFKGLWMPPYQARGRLLKSGMTEKDIYKRTLFSEDQRGRLEY